MSTPPAKTGAITYLGSDAAPALPRYETFKVVAPATLDPAYSTDGTASADGTLTGVTNFSYSPGYHDLKLTFQIIDTNTYASGETPFQLTMRAGDTPEPMMTTYAQYSGPDTSSPIYVGASIQQSGPVVSQASGALLPGQGLNALWTAQVIGSVFSVSATDPQGRTQPAGEYPDMQLGITMPFPNTPPDYATGFILEFSRPVTLAFLNMEHPALTRAGGYASITRPPRRSTASATGAQPETVPGYGYVPGAGGGGTTYVSATAAITRAPRKLAMHSSQTAQILHATAAVTRAPRTATLGATAIQAVLVQATAAITRQPRTLNANAKLLSDVQFLIGDLTQNQAFIANYLSELEFLAGDLRQPQEGDAALVSLEELVDTGLEQPQSLSGLIAGLGTPLIPTSPTQRGLHGALSQFQSFVGLFVPLGPGASVVSGSSPTQAGQRGDTVVLPNGMAGPYPGPAVMTPREYDVRDGEHSPDTETGFSRRKSYERKAVSEHEQTWSYPGSNPQVNVVGPLYRSLRHTGSLTEFVFTAAVAIQTLNEGSPPEHIPITVGLLHTGVEILQLTVPEGRTNWSVLLDVAYDYNDTFAPVLLSAGATLTDMVVYLYFKQTDWVRVKGTSTALPPVKQTTLQTTLQ